MVVSFVKKGPAAKDTLDAIMAPVGSFQGKALFDQADDLKTQADLLYVERAGVLLKLARLVCPYPVGTTLKLNRGLGAGGLVVEEIRAAENPAPYNRWAVQTAAIAKDGSLSRRTLLLSEWQLSKHENAGLSILEVKVPK